MELPAFRVDDVGLSQHRGREPSPERGVGGRTDPPAGLVQLAAGLDVSHRDIMAECRTCDCAIGLWDPTKMEEWFKAGELTAEEMQTFLRLLARFAGWNVDQWENLVMWTPHGPMFIDFNAGGSNVPIDEYSPVWPLWGGSGPRWTVWREDQTGQ
jgi:hypothetical protein